MSVLLCFHCPLHPLIDDSVWHFDAQSLSRTLYPGPDFWHLSNVVMCSCTWSGPCLVDSSYLQAFWLIDRRGQKPESTVKSAAPPNDGHGNLGRRWAWHDLQAFLRSAHGSTVLQSLFLDLCFWPPTVCSMHNHASKKG